ncbi:unnamed protein product, partial [Rhizoctonia solani]
MALIAVSLLISPTFSNVPGYQNTRNLREFYDKMPLYMLTGRPKTRNKKYGYEWNKRSKPDKGVVPQPFYIVEPPQEFDERGKELSPDAQVWKTYVREADQVDGELVDGWNKSTDVIL